jgi:hypothetical protein
MLVLLMVLEDGQSGDGRNLWKTESSLCWLGKSVNLVCHYCNLVMQKRTIRPHVEVNDIPAIKVAWNSAGSWMR